MLNIYTYIALTTTNKRIIIIPIIIVIIARMVTAKTEGLNLVSCLSEPVDCISVHSILHSFIVMLPKCKPSALKSFKSNGNTLFSDATDVVIISIT